MNKVDSGLQACPRSIGRLNEREFIRMVSLRQLFCITHTCNVYLLLFFIHLFIGKRSVRVMRNILC